MTIRFSCPQCGSGLQAKLEQTGRQGKCPACEGLFRVPQPASAEQPPAPIIKPLHAAAGDADEGDYGLAPVELAPVAAPPAAPMPAVGDSHGSAGAFLLDCFASFWWGLRNIPNVIVLLLAYTLVGFVLFVGCFLVGAVLVQTTAGTVMAGFLFILLYLTMGGYLVRYFMDVAAAGVEGFKEPVPAPNWDFAQQVSIALKSIGLTIVYVLPIVTIPLQPLGLMALAHTNDGRAFNLVWAIRAALRRPGRLLGAWAMVLLVSLVGGIASMIVMAAGFAILGAATVGGVGGKALFWVVMFVTILMYVVVFFSAVCINFRCVGLMGHHDPRLLEMLPDEPNGMVSLAFVTLGLAMSVGAYLAVGESVLAVADRIYAIGPPSGGLAYTPGFRSPQPRWPWERPPTVRDDRPSIRAPSPRVKDKYQLMADAHTGLEKVARKYVEYCRSHGGAPPPSLMELASATGLKDEDLRSPGDPSRWYVLVRDVLGVRTSDAAIVLYDPAKYLNGDVVYFADRRGLVVRLREEVFKKKLAEQVNAAGKLARQVFRRQRVPMHRPDASSAAVNLQNLRSDLHEYARRHGRRFPDSLEALKAGGLVRDELDLRSPGDTNRSLVYIPSQTEFTPASNILAYDPTTYQSGSRQGVVVLYVDGRTERLSDMAAVREKLSRQTPSGPALTMQLPPYRRPLRRLVLRRSAIPSLSSPAWARGSPNIRNLLADLYNYANAHEGKFPPSLEAMQQAGRVPDTEDLRSPGDRKRSYVYIPGQDAAGPADNILAYDPVEYRVGTATVRVYAATVAGRTVTLNSMAELRRRLAAQTPSVPELTMVLPPPKAHVPRRSFTRYGVNPRLPGWSQTPNNLRNLYAGLYRYAYEHEGRFPPSLAALLEGGYVKDLTDLRCLSQPTRSYVYIPGQKVGGDRDAILAYDPVAHIVSRSRTAAYVLTVGGVVRSFKSVAEIKRKLAPQAHLGSGVSMRLPDPSQVRKPPPPVRDPPQPPRPTVVERPGPTDPAGKVTWDVPYWYKTGLSDDHPFLKVCHALRQVREQGATGVAGVGFGPTAKDKADDAYVRFRDKALEHFDANGGKAPRSVRREHPHRIDGVEYDRITVIRGFKMFALYTGIAEGRCVSYWYFGARTPFIKFTTGVGKARFQPEK